MYYPHHIPEQVAEGICLEDNLEPPHLGLLVEMDREGLKQNICVKVTNDYYNLSFPLASYSDWICLK